MINDFFLLNYTYYISVCSKSGEHLFDESLCGSAAQTYVCMCVRLRNGALYLHQQKIKSFILDEKKNN